MKSIYSPDEIERHFIRATHRKSASRNDDSKGVTMLRKIIVTFLFLFFFTSSTYAADEVIRFLCLSDIHFDPFSACHGKSSCPAFRELQAASVAEWQSILEKYSGVPAKNGQDTNFPLLHSTLNSAKIVAEQEHVQFILILGDFLRHEFPRLYRKYSNDQSVASYQLFVKKTLQFLSQQINHRFPKMNVYVLLGNNDTYQHDYVSQPDGDFYKDTSEVFANLIKDKQNRAAFLDQFPLAGYYAINLSDHPDIRLMMLNSVLFSYKAKGKNVPEVAQQEMLWLQTELSAIKEKKQKAIIALHIPVALDFYATPNLYLFTLMKFWKPRFNDQYHQVLQAFSSEILGVYSGHLHSEWQHYLTLKHPIPMAGVPAVSPIFGGMQGFVVYTYSYPTLQFKRVKTYRLNTEPVDMNR